MGLQRLSKHKHNLQRKIAPKCPSSTGFSCLIRLVELGELLLYWLDLDFGNGEFLFKSDHELFDVFPVGHDQLPPDFVSPASLLNLVPTERQDSLFDSAIDYLVRLAAHWGDQQRVHRFE